MVDEAVEVLDLAVDRGRALLAVGLATGRCRGRRLPAAARIVGQRRPQVVRDRLEQRGLERVALAGDLRGLRLGGEPILGERLADLVGGGRQEPRLASGPGSPAARSAQRPDRPEDVAARPRSARGRFLGVAGAAAFAPGRRWTRTHWAAGRPGCAAEHLLDAGLDVRPDPSPCRRTDLLARVVRPERDPDVRDMPDLVPEEQRRWAQDASRVDGRVASSRLTREQRARLALARLRDVGARPLERRQLPDDDADEQEQDEVEPLARVGDREGVQRGDEEEVVEQERADGGDDRAGGARDVGRRHHGEEVGARRVGHPDHALEQRDGPRGEPERRRTGPDAAGGARGGRTIVGQHD